MSGKYDDNMRGALFPNLKKDRENSPDYRGEAEVNGVKYWISGWKSVSKGHQAYLSLSFRPKDGRPTPSSPGPRGQESMEKKPDFDDDIPF